MALFGALAALLIGTSVHGRPLQAYELGNTSSTKTVLVVGCIHGDECAGLDVVRRLRATRPAFDLWLVPTVNPDGYAAHTRANANGVDLNRDFAARTQPETRAAARLIRRIRPDVTIWFHQHQNLVRAWGPSVAAGRRFARRAGFRFRALAWPPGSATRWQNTTFPGARSFAVELPAGRLSAAHVTRLTRAVLAL
jgi:protein MpaA